MNQATQGVWFNNRKEGSVERGVCGLRRPEMRSLEIVGLRSSRCLVGTKGQESGFLRWIRTRVWCLAMNGLVVSQTIGWTLSGGNGGTTEAESESAVKTRKMEAEDV